MGDALRDSLLAMGAAAKAASRRLAAMSTAERGSGLRAMSDAVIAQASEIRGANEHDVRAATAAGRNAAFVDRLRLDQARVEAMADGFRSIAGEDDPVGQVLEVRTPPSGIRIEKVSVPLGVIVIVYESRPNVTADAAGLCLKAGNASILRGGSDAMRTNQAIHGALVGGLVDAGLPRDAVQLVETTDRRAVEVLTTLEGLVDLVIPRGGESLIRAVASSATVPVLKHYKGVCHVYVDAAADLDMALAIAVNAKCQRPGVCNAMETLLVHRAVAATFLTRVEQVLGGEHGVVLRGDDAARAIMPGTTVATEDDWAAEYLEMILAVRVVDDIEAAIAHIEQYGSHHSDAIVTADDDAAARFLSVVDSATVYHNASTRFTDGSAFGMGAEIGISTDKLHARGPCGAQALTTYKYIVRGSGEIRS